MKLLVLLFSAVFMLTSCNTKQVSDLETEDDKIKIGLLMDNFVQERWQRDRDIFVARANELGAEVIVQIANSDTEEQEKQALYLLDQDIKVLVIIAHDSKKAASIIRSAKSRNVKTICYDRLILNASADVYVAFDSTEVGEKMARVMLNNVKEGNYLIINGSPLDNNVSLFNEGYYNILRRSIELDKVKIVGEFWANDWRYEEAFNFVKDTLASDINIDAIIAGNDTLASAAINALAERRLLEEVLVVGHDAELEACQRIVEGTQIATVYKPIDKLAKMAAEIAIDLADGKDLEYKDTIFDGRSDIPFIKISSVLVTADNMYDEIIRTDFHKLENIYKNVPKYLWPEQQ